MSKILLSSAVAASVILSGCSVFQPSPAPQPPSSSPPSPPPQVRRVEPPRVEAPRVEPPQAVAPRPEPRADPPPHSSEPGINESEQLSKLIDYAQSVAAMSAFDQRRELGIANQALVREKSPLARLRLALLLCLPGTVIEEEGRALSLLESLSTGSSPAGPLRSFAGLLHAQLAERVREQKRSAQMREQLDALKAMERSLMRRSQGRPR